MKFSEFIFIDLETTGLDEKKDQIIEIGAVKVNAQLKELSRFHTLVKPTIPIPYAVTILTHGLDNELVKDAPSISQVKKDLLNFIGDAPLIAHNSNFESAFLKRHVSPSMSNLFADTMELFSVFFPSIGSLKLDTIVKELGVRDNELHRALADAEDLYNVILKIEQKMHYDHDWYLVAKRLTEYFLPEEWFWSSFVGGILPHEPPTQKPFQDSDDTIEHVRSSGPKTFAFSQFKVDAEEVSSLIKSPMEERLGQKEYIKQIADSFNSDSSIMIEAGTGIGKTLGYLLPSVRWAIDNSGVVVVSTKTKMLQHQVLENDMPKAKDLLGIKDLKAVKVQGRNNYLCVRKMDRFFSGVELTDSFETKFSKLFFFALDHLSAVADFTRIPSWIMRNFPHVSRMLGVLCADTSSCLQVKCSYYKECHYFKMVKEAKKSKILVANHSLVMNWPSHLPQGDKIVFDEAHNLISEAIEATTIKVDGGTLKNIVFVMDDGSGSKGVITELRKLRVREDLIAKISMMSSSMADADLRFTDVFSRLFARIAQRNNKPTVQEYSEKYVLYSPTIVKGNYNLSEMDEWKESIRYVSALYNDSDVLGLCLKESSTFVKDDEYKMILLSICEKIDELKVLCEGVLKIYSDSAIPKEDLVYWVSWDAKRIEWQIARSFMDIGGVLATKVYSNYSSCVFTSATLKTGKTSLAKELGFNEIQGRVVSDDVIAIPSPFNYKDHSCLFFMKETLNPNDPLFIKHLSSMVAGVAQLLGGRTLVLFSSIKRMNACFSELALQLSSKGFKVLKQDMGGDIIGYFMSEKNVVLLGSETLGEGLDIKGESLSCVIMERMPVMMRTPLYVAREDLYKKTKNSNSYMGFDLPQRLLKLRQWSGRLIRSNSDKGVVVVYDNWFVRQRPEMQKEVVDAMLPMPVEVSSYSEIVQRMKEKYIEWDYELN